MPKKLVQDIIVHKKGIHTIKRGDISSRPIVEDRKEIQRPAEKKIVIEKVERFSSSESPQKITRSSQVFLWLLSFLSVAILIFILSSFFSTANLTVTPKSAGVSLDDTFTASANTTAGSGLYFEVMTIKKTGTKELATDGEEKVERKATGKAIIYNNYSTSKQYLIINTRLETSAGLVYKIRDSVNVPGYKIISGSKVPGSIEVDIIADTAGDTYNMKISDLKGDFTIPGLKGSTKYTNFYARLSTDITGGFIGTVKKVSDEKLTAGTSELRNQLKEDLLVELYQKKPENYALFKDNYFIEYTDRPDQQTDKDKYEISEEASINAIIFKKEDLAEFIAKTKIEKFDTNQPVDMLWGDDLSVSVSSTDTKPWTLNSLKFKFKGGATIVWSYDKDILIQSILGQNKNVINQLVNDKFKPAIQSMSVIIRPQWKSSFPENSNKIRIYDSVREANITD